MNTKIAFACLVERANKKADEAICLVQNIPVTTNVSVVLYADKRIKELEAEVLRLQKVSNNVGLALEWE